MKFRSLNFPSIDCGAYYFLLNNRLCLATFTQLSHKTGFYLPSLRKSDKKKCFQEKLDLTYFTFWCFTKDERSMWIKWLKPQKTGTNFRKMKRKQRENETKILQ